MIPISFYFITSCMPLETLTRTDSYSPNSYWPKHQTLLGPRGQRHSGGFLLVLHVSIVHSGCAKIWFNKKNTSLSNYPYKSICLRVQFIWKFCIFIIGAMHLLSLFMRAVHLILKRVFWCQAFSLCWVNWSLRGPWSMDLLTTKMGKSIENLTEPPTTRSCTSLSFIVDLGSLSTLAEIEFLYKLNVNTRYQCHDPPCD